MADPAAMHEGAISTQPPTRTPTPIQTMNRAIPDTQQPTAQIKADTAEGFGPEHDSDVHMAQLTDGQDGEIMASVEHGDESMEGVETRLVTPLQSLPLRSDGPSRPSACIPPAVSGLPDVDVSRAFSLRHSRERDKDRPLGLGKELGGFASRWNSPGPLQLQDEVGVDALDVTPEVDEDSLFVPECSPPRRRKSASVRSNMGPPVQSSLVRANPAGPSPAGPSPAGPRPVRPSLVVPGRGNIFSRISNLQAMMKRTRAATKRPPPLNPRCMTPDNEAYLASIQTPTLTPSTPQAIDLATLEEDEDRNAAAAFLQHKQRYDIIKKKNGGQLPFREGVEWMRIQGDECARRKKLAHDRSIENEGRDDGDPALFPESPRDGSDGGESHDGSDDDVDLDDSFRSRKRRRPEAPRRGHVETSMRDFELASMRVGLDLEGDMPKKKKKRNASKKQVGDHQGAPSSSRGGRGSKAKSSRATKTTKASSTKKTTGKRQSAKDKRKAQQAIDQATSFFTADVFRQQAPEDAAEQPTFKSRNKTDALKELISSVAPKDQKDARCDMSELLAATKDFNGRGAVRADGNGMWLVKGMRTSLRAYQILGSAFMRRRENAAEEPRGGLVADQMGLGKTLMMLANIVNGRAPKDKKNRTTLLVASPALLTQWAKEIDLHTSTNLKIMRYGAGTRIDSNRAFEILGAHDMILTTYTEVMKSYPKNEPPIDCQTTEEKIEWWKKTYATQRGVLHQMTFLRVVLDEAQAIKNHTGRTSIACRALMAEHRWAISGTPVLNGLPELYPYFKFLGVPHTGSFKIFKYNYCDNKDTEKKERLLVRLSQFMLRRTHADQMFGTHILKLPKADQNEVWSEFNSVERTIYDIVRQRFTTKINMLSQKGELDGSYSNVMVMLLRLRQLAAHVLMLQFVMRDLLEREDIERIRRVMNEAASQKDGEGARVILAVRKQLDSIERNAEQSGNDEQDGDGATPEDRGEDDEDGLEGENRPRSPRGPGRNTGQTFGKAYNFKPFLNSLTTGEQWEEVKKKARCSLCQRRPAKPWMSSCGHLICEKCYFTSAGEAAEEMSREQPSCKACGATPSYFQRCDPEDDSDDAYVGPETRAKKQRQSCDGKRVCREDISDDWLSLGGDTVLPSAKTIAIKAQILNWVRQNGKVKIIIYTQFLAMIRILAKVCQEEGWGTEQYHGKMSLSARDKAINAFADDSDVRVLLSSLRCGGLGLNLTMASRVIIVDPWWNTAVEQQAFCRVFRIGQEQTTSMMRMCVQDTVDTRIIEMQKRKKEEIDAVMEDGGKTARRLGIRDLMRLFGNLTTDESGRPFIMVDNADPRGGFRADDDHEGFADDV